MTPLEALLAENERIMRRTRAKAARNRPANPNAKKPGHGHITNKNVRKLICQAIESGQITYLGMSGRTHPRFRCPDGQVIQTAGTGSDRHQEHALRRELERHGVRFD